MKNEKTKTVKEFKEELEEIIKKYPECADFPIFHSEQAKNRLFITVKSPELYLRNLRTERVEKTQMKRLALLDRGEEKANCLLIHFKEKDGDESKTALNYLKNEKP